MKKYIITFFILLSCLVISAQDKLSREELKSQCIILQNEVNKIKGKIGDIQIKQIEKLNELGIRNYHPNELSQLNQVICDGFEEILQTIPKVYDRDTTSNIAIKQLDELHRTFSKYCTSISKDDTISISGDFQKVIEDVTKEIVEIKAELKVSDDAGSTSEKSNIIDNVEGFFSVKWVMLALIFLQYLIVFTLIFFVKKKFKDTLYSSIKGINQKIASLQETIDKLNSNVGSKGLLNSINSSHSFGQNELNNLKQELQNEINKVKNELKIIKESAAHFRVEGGSNNTKNIGQDAVSNSKNPQKNTKTSHINGLFAQLQSDGTFKIYEEDKETAFYIIEPDSSSKTSGVFTLKELTPESEKSAIDNRNNLLFMACDIEQTTNNPKRIKVEAYGIAEKNGNKWHVKEKAKISLVD